jgi:hypothetical protein
MKALSEHRVEAGLFAIGTAALALGISLIALPGTGMWSTIGWLATIVGLLCLLLSALLWPPIGSRLVRRLPGRRRVAVSRALITDEFVQMIDEGNELRGDAFSGEAPWRFLGAWQEQGASFIETTLGVAERQRFLDAGSEAEDRLTGLLGWLRARRDDVSPWAPLHGIDVLRAIAVRREAWRNVGVIDSPEIDVALSVLDPLVTDRSSVIELRIGNRASSELQDVLVRLEVPVRISLRRTTRSGDEEKEGHLTEEEETRGWAEQIGPLAPRSTRTLYFSVLVPDTAEIPVAARVRVAERPWLVTRFSFRAEPPVKPVPKSSRARPYRRSPDGDRAALGRLYVEGRRMQKAADPLAGITAVGLLYGSPPDEPAVERWEGRVRAALPRSYRSRFTFGTLDAQADRFLLRAITPWPESAASRRLKTSLEELQRIIEELDEAAIR